MKKLAICLASGLLACTAMLGMSGCSGDKVDEGAVEALSALQDAILATDDSGSADLGEGDLWAGVNYSGYSGDYSGTVDVSYSIPDDLANVGEIELSIDSEGSLDSDISQYFFGYTDLDYTGLAYDVYAYGGKLYTLYGTGSSEDADDENTSIDPMYIETSTIDDTILTAFDAYLASSDNDGVVELTDFASYVNAYAYDGTEVEVTFDITAIFLDIYSQQLDDEWGISGTDALDAIAIAGESLGSSYVTVCATIEDDGTLCALSLTGSVTYDPYALEFYKSYGYYDYYYDDLDITFNLSFEDVEASDEAVEIPDLSAYGNVSEGSQGLFDYGFDDMLEGDELEEYLDELYEYYYEFGEELLDEYYEYLYDYGGGTDDSDEYNHDDEVMPIEGTEDV